jgi:hypothetical protein
MSGLLAGVSDFAVRTRVAEQTADRAGFFLPGGRTGGFLIDALLTAGAGGAFAFLLSAARP